MHLYTFIHIHVHPHTHMNTATLAQNVHTLILIQTPGVAPPENEITQDFSSGM